MKTKTKRNIVEHVAMYDSRLAMFSTKYIIETSIFHEDRDKVVAIIGGNEYVFNWVKNDKINYANDFRYVCFEKNKSLVEYY